MEKKFVSVVLYLHNQENNIKNFFDSSYKTIKENFENILRKINILKWMKVYTILMNKEIQNINLCLNTLKRMYSFNSGKQHHKTFIRK